MQSQTYIAELNHAGMYLERFSSTTTSRTYAGPLPWEHLTDLPLFVTFEAPASPDGLLSTAVQTRMKVNNGATVLVSSLALLRRSSANSSKEDIVLPLLAQAVQRAA